ncbi:Ca-activated chloride channel family protein [Hydrobacter penzbergensis]|uniref:Ca-activated chloride channel family protein n=1 Tax=Hydrobacter penzbergensis TaxID=1235997 RepID=A0A8X8IDZ4_9BACT|nr:VWA domain-containing protein [Hydrobacter penzbergensis]SDW24092.1 Ca-activated chloride channel family protein [Hydrobacter penzbergensis]
MKAVAWLLLACSFPCLLMGQNYLRGEVKDEQGRLLQGVRIQLASTGTYPYYTGNLGSFGIPSSRLIDTITLSYEGYDTLRTAIDTRKTQFFVLKMQPELANFYRARLSSLTNHLQTEPVVPASVMGESYSDIMENRFIQASQYPETGFALNIDKASYSNIRRFIHNNMRVPVHAIRIEEMLNYFSYPAAENSRAFTCQTTVTSCPWQQEHQLLYLHIHAPQLQLDSVPPSNLVFLIDVSGSMDKPNRLPLLQSAFKLLADNLRPQDTISIMTYGGNVRIALAPTGGAEKKKIKAVIDSLSAAGDTPGAGAIQQAYALASHTYMRNGNNRVILATDGDFNVGQSSEKELEDLIVQYRKSGIYLTCLGVGMGNYKDSKLEVLAKKGNGNFAYLDHLGEAQKVLVTEFTQTLYAVANNATVIVRFNPSLVKTYRLIGFDNKRTALNDSTRELEGGEIGSGHALMALFEIEPATTHSSTENLASIDLRYQLPDSASFMHHAFTASNQPIAIEKAEHAYQFAAAVSMFGAVLKGSPYTKDLTLEKVLAFAEPVVDPANIQQEELLQLIKQAIEIYHPSKKRKKKK